jgi:hypothetical protein
MIFIEIDKEVNACLRGCKFMNKDDPWNPRKLVPTNIDVSTVIIVSTVYILNVWQNFCALSVQ